MNYTLDLMQREQLAVIATPTVGGYAPLFKESFKSSGLGDISLAMNLTKHVFFANFLGLPAHSVPIGLRKCPLSGENLPVGLQLIGKYWSENVLLRLANAVDYSDLIYHKNYSSVEKKKFYSPLRNSIVGFKKK